MKCLDVDLFVFILLVVVDGFSLNFRNVAHYVLGYFPAPFSLSAPLRLPLTSVGTLALVSEMPEASSFFSSFLSLCFQIGHFFIDLLSLLFLYFALLILLSSLFK